MPSYVVTGASRGLGYAYIKHLAADPSNTVIGIVRNTAAASARLAADKISNVHLLAADVTDAAALAAAAADAAQITGGALDVLIHNAALVSTRSADATLADGSATPAELEDDLLTSFRANTVGTAHTVNAFLPLVRRGRDKKVVVISTGLADAEFTRRFDVATAAPYAVSKAATNLLVAKYHAALGRAEGILFLALSPGLVDTSEGNAASMEDREKYRKMFVEQFKDYAPDFTGPIEPEESVRLALGVIGKATVEADGGDFVSHFGNKQWL